MKLKKGGKMLDYRKIMSSILFIFLLITSCYATEEDKKAEETLKEISTYVVNYEWDFENTNFKFEINEIWNNILKKKNIKPGNFYLQIKKLVHIYPITGEYYYIIEVGCVLKVKDGFWLGNWTLPQNDTTIIEDIRKIERNQVSSKTQV